MNHCLIAYFSREGNNYVNGSIVNLTVGNTEVVAKIMENDTKGTLFKIEPLKKYSTDYTACTKEAQQELRAKARPKLSAYLANIDSYDTIILGYPNYWGTFPMSVMTFLESLDFTGKRILPFCTHEGSGMGHSEADIKRACPNAKVEKGLAIQGGKVRESESLIVKWLESYGI